jgi:hypothetical protein
VYQPFRSELDPLFDIWARQDHLFWSSPDWKEEMILPRSLYA